jgi:hypothetical protein
MPLQASLFAVYEPFCSGQHEANEIISKIARRHKDAWDAYERHCTELLSAEHGHRRRQSDCRPALDRVVRSSADLTERGRRHSVDAVFHSSSVEAPRRAALDGPRPEMGERAESASVTKEKDVDKGPRLKLADYLVKPMQRITRYPLLLAALLIQPPPPGQSVLRSPLAPGLQAIDFAGPDVVVASARLAMDHAAAQIDAAASAQAAHVQSARIAARLAPAPHIKVAKFVSGLGTCVLAGALDVVHHRALRDLGSGSVRAKYLAAFLYAGGFLVLAKVHGARRYEPRHWFDLAGFEVDGTDDSGWLALGPFGVWCTDAFPGFGRPSPLVDAVVRPRRRV